MRLVQKVGRRIADNFNSKGLHRLDITVYVFRVFTFFLFCVINVVDYYLCLYNFIRRIVALYM